MYVCVYVHANAPLLHDIQGLRVELILNAAWIVRFDDDTVRVHLLDQTRYYLLASIQPRCPAAPCGYVGIAKTPGGLTGWPAIPSLLALREMDKPVWTDAQVHDCESCQEIWKYHLHIVIGRVKAYPAEPGQRGWSKRLPE